MNAIEIRNLCKSYPGFSLDNLNLTLPSGCILGLVGENGAGKSTTIKLMLDMIHKDSGTVSLLGQEKLSKEDIGVVLDEVGIPGCLNARQVGNIMANTYRRWDGDAYLGYLAAMGIDEGKPFKSYSRGMKMKLGIAIALSHHAKLLILDEATSGLDPVIRDEILDMFTDFTRDENHSILLSSHIVSDLEKICDYVAFLHKGKLLLMEEKDALREEFSIIHCSRQQFEAISPAAVIGKKESPYGVEAVVKKEEVPQGVLAGPADIEQLFIFMVKEAQRT